jgi:glutathione S-transferase
MSTLTHFPLCPFSRSIRLLLGEFDVPFTLAEEKPWEWRPELLALNPSGDLPVLQLVDHTVLAGSYAIAEYFGDSVRAAPPDEREADPFPGTLEDRAEARRLVDWFHRKLDNEVVRELLKEKLYPRLRTDVAPQPPDPELMRALRTNLRYHIGYVGFLADQRRWLAGDRLTFADMAAAAHISVLDYLDEIPWETAPAAREWYTRMKSRPSFRPLLADRVTGVAPAAHYADLDF